MSQTLIRWFHESRARALAFGVALALLLTLAGCSGAENNSGGSDANSSEQGASQQETTQPGAPEEQDDSEEADAGEEQAQQDSSGGGAAAPQQEQGSQEQPSRDSGPEEPSSPEEQPIQQGSGQEGSDQEAGLASRGQVVTVSRVVDGDTIEVSPAVDGIEDVRLIGVDTPETYGGEEPLGPQASAFTTDALAGREVALEFDEERVDQYGRALAYVWVSGGGMFNSQLLREGLAQVATFPPNTEYVDRFESIQAEARTANLGIWGLPLTEQCKLADRGNGIGDGSPGCTRAEPETTQPTPAPEPAPPAGGDSAPPVSEDNCPNSHPIKGNEDSGIYHPPSGGSYSVTNPEVCFASAGAAEASGYRAAQN